MTGPPAAVDGNRTGPAGGCAATAGRSVPAGSSPRTPWRARVGWGSAVADPATLPTGRTDCPPLKAFPVRKAHGIVAWTGALGIGDRRAWGSVQRWGCRLQSALRSRRPTLLRNGSGRLHPQSLDAPYALRTVAPNVVRADLSRQPPSSDAQHQVQPSHLPESRSARRCRQGGRLSPPASAGIRRLPSFGAP